MRSIFSSSQVQRDVITPPSWVAKILKIPVFRLSLGNDLISQIFISIHNFFSRICQGRSRSFSNFDPAIAQRSLDRFIALGATAQFVVPRDGKGRIQMMTFRAQNLEHKIQELGGSWERRVLSDREVLAIIPPEQESEAWADLKEKITHFHWPEEEGMFITCDFADAIPNDAPAKCFLFAHSTSNAFTSDWKRAGFYIGAKQDFCFFDNGNTWKNRGRRPSEESFYLEIEAVYEQLKDTYPLEHLWIGGSCGGAPVAAYLKRHLHEQGVNFFVEQSFSDLNDFVKPISPFFASRVKGSVSDGHFALEMENPPPSCHFDVQRLWENLNEPKGKMILVQVKDDEHISQAAYERYLKLAQSVNEHVRHIFFASTAKYRHGDDFFRYQMPRRNFMKAVFE